MDGKCTENEVVREGMDISESLQNSDQDMTNPPIKPRFKISPKLKKCLLIGASSVVGLILIFIIIYLIDGRIAVAAAFSATFDEYKEENELYKTLNIKEITDDKEYTLNIDMNTEISNIGDVTFTADAAVVDEVMETKGTIELSFASPIEYTLWLDKEEIRASTPLLEDYQFVYDYTKENNGYLMSYISDQDKFNSYLSKIYQVFCDGKSADRMKERFQEILIEDFGDVKLKKTLSKACTINNQEVNAKGYRADLSEEKLKKFAEEFSVYVKEYLYDSLKGIGLDVDEYLDRMVKQCAGAKEASVTVYVYKNKLAAVVLSANENTFEIRFLGGDYRVADLVIYDNDTEVLNLKTEKEGTVIKRTLTVPQTNKKYKYSYNTDSGDLNVTVQKGYEQQDFDMNIERKRNGLYIDVDYFDMADTYLRGTLLLSRGASLSQMEGEEFNLGTSSEEEITGLMAEVYDVLMKLMGW